MPVLYWQVPQFYQADNSPQKIISEKGRSGCQNSENSKRIIKKFLTLERQSSVFNILLKIVHSNNTARLLSFITQ